VTVRAPPAFAAVTAKRCVPSPTTYDRGDAHADAAPPSSEHVTDVGEPPTANVKTAIWDVVVPAGYEVKVTVGTPVDVGGGAGAGGGAGDAIVHVSYAV